MPVSTVKISEKLTAGLSVLFGFAQRQADYKKLNRHIIALNQRQSAREIIDEVSFCLKSILNYRLFAFAFRRNATGSSTDVWLNPRMYKQSLESVILKDFNLNTAAHLNYINQSFIDGHNETNFDLDPLVSYELMETQCQGRLYMLPSRTLFDYHDEIIQQIMQSAGAALARQMDIETLRATAAVDALTGCYNRREFETHLNRQIGDAVRHNTPLSVFMFDLDHFKKINDTYGHLAGDAVLREVACEVMHNMRGGDILARYGGEEFIAILPKTTKARAMELADRLRRTIAGLKIKSGCHLIRVTASFGVAQFDRHTDMDRIIHDADTMLYKAKLNGRNTVMPGVMKICGDTISPPSRELRV